MHCLKREVTGYIVSEQGSIPSSSFQFFALILRPAVGIVVMVGLYEQQTCILSVQSVVQLLKVARCRCVPCNDIH